MLNRSRLASKKESKTEAVQSVAAERLAGRDIHIGPSDYVAWQNDNKVCFLRMEGKALRRRAHEHGAFGSRVEDSPNSAGVAIDAIRCARSVVAFSLRDPGSRDLSSGSAKGGAWPSSAWDE